MFRVLQYDANHQVQFFRQPTNDLKFKNRNNAKGFVKDQAMKTAFLNAYDLSVERFLGFNEEQFYQYIEEFQDSIACQFKDLKMYGIFYVQEKKLLARQHQKVLQSIDIPQVSTRLKMVDYAKSLVEHPVFRGLYQRTLSNTLLVLTQQGYSTVVNVIQALIDLGFNPYNLIIFTKPTTTSDENFETIKALAEQYHFKYVTPDRRLHQGKTEEELKQFAINKIVREVEQQLNNNDGIKNVIYYDEGGVLVNDDNFRRICVQPWKDTKKISMSEHTTSGVNRYKTNLQDMDCFMFARSWIKLKCEPFFIAQSSYAQVKQKLLEVYHQRHTLVVGLIGCGNVGSEFARCLIEFAIHKQVRILIHDEKFRTSADYPNDLIELARVHGVTVQFAGAELNRQLVSQSDFIFGATGSDISHCLTQAIPQANPKYLASISSGKREFKTIVDESAAEHSTSSHQINGQNYLLLNRGYPLNFKRTKDSVDPLQIQLIRASSLLLIFQELMYLQKLETLDKIPQDKKQQSRFLRFNAFFQSMLWNRFKALQADTPEHLRVPDRILNQLSNVQDMIDFSLAYDREQPDQAMFEIDNAVVHDENFLTEYDKNHELHFKEEKDRIIFVFKKHGLEIEDLDMLNKICQRNEFDRHIFSLDTRAGQLYSMMQRFSKFNPSAVNVSEMQFDQSYHR